MFKLYLIIAFIGFVFGGDFCDRSDCNDHGNCIGLEAFPICFCDINYIGIRCEINLLNKDFLSTDVAMDAPAVSSSAVCTALDCSNQGTCLKIAGNNVCLCHAGFVGADCKEKFTSLLNTDPNGAGATILCTASDCSNNGICVGTKAAFSCMCKIGFTGTRCEKTPYPLCQNSYCSNNGICFGTTEAPFCACNLLYSGKTCDKVAENLCDMSDCSNSGLCTGTKSKYSCLCAPGYSGARCETPLLAGPLGDLGFCDLKTCNGNGLCFGTKLFPTCICNLGYLGLRCEIEPLCNSLLQCNGQICLGTFKNPICACSIGFTGTHCENKLF
uniref:EGF-like domain-containing protein n=1 Tax=Rhabditophanes sp. KR3021 TaxID=114890 RepID=A0AC35U9S5_9BILA